MLIEQEQIKTQLGLTSNSLTRKFAYFLKPQNYDYMVFYPPYNNLYSADITPSRDLKEYLKQISEQKPKISFFFAIPWCFHKCPYCIYHCNIDLPSEKYQEKYLDSLIQELRLYLGCLKQSSIDTIYIGGGTPSLLKPSLLAHFLKSLSFAIGQNGKSLDNLAELNFEIHPNDNYKELIPILKNYISTPQKLRISLGAQSFIDEHIHNIRDKNVYKNTHILKAFEFLCNSEVKTNVDLMWGLSGKNISNELDFIKNKGIYPTTFTFYQIQSPGDVERHENYVENIEKDTLKILRQREEIFNTLVDSHNYEPILFPAYFQKNEHGAIYNTKQMAKNCYYIGLGVSGHSKLERWAYRNTEDIKRYMELVTAGKFPIDYVTKLSDDDIKKRDNLLRMRLPDQTFQKNDLTDLFKDTTNENDIDELLETFFVKNHENYKLNRKGKIFVDEIIRCAVKNDVSLMARFDKRIINTYIDRNETKRNDRNNIKIENILSFMKNTVGQILVQETNIKEFVANIGYTSEHLPRPVINKNPIGLINYQHQWKDAFGHFEKLQGDKLYFFSELFNSLSQIGIAYPLSFAGNAFGLDESREVKDSEKIFKRLCDAIKSVKDLKALNKRYKEAKAQKSLGSFWAMFKLFHWYVEDLDEDSNGGQKNLYFLMTRTATASAGGVAVALRLEDPNKARLYLSDLTRYMEEIYTLISEAEFRERMINFALGSAIAAIMSRNMSHNIGSHILIDLEKSRGEDYHIKHFLGYLRLRMDFLAQIATDWPSWSLPTRFLQDLMLEFLNQLCLLKYIGASENLNEGKLFFKIDIDGEVFSRVDANSDEVERLRKKVSEIDRFVSILGGVTGRQALYIILENIIRNAAKHSYKSGSLEINIKLSSIVGKNSYKVEIWDNVSKEKGLDNSINEKIETPIIKPTGEIERGNWGIAEMKIASAYLQKKNSVDLGGKGKKNYDIIKAGKHDSSNGDQVLKYTFYLPKPKEVLIWDLRKGPEKLQASDELKKNSVFVKNEMHFNDTDYEFMVVRAEDNDVENVLKTLLAEETLEKLSYRLFFVGKIPKNVRESHPYAKQRLVSLDRNFLPRKNNTDQAIQDFKLRLYVEWIKHLRDTVRRDIKGAKVSLYLNLAGENGGGRGPYFSDYLEKNYPYLIPEGIDDPRNLGNSAKGDWQELGSEIRRKGSGMSEVIRSIYFEDAPSQIADHEVVISYPRHNDIPPYVGDTIEKFIYREDLSGASPHFSLLASPPGDLYQRKKLTLWMVENGLLRIAVADERIAKQLWRHHEELMDHSGIYLISQVKKGNMEVSIVPDIPENESNKLEISDQANYASEIKTEGSAKTVDALIIHQGILDKMTRKGFWGKGGDSRNWIKNLKEKIPFVVVTSGRGKPDEVPNNAKFVPFSDIQHAFSSGDQHHSKLLLTSILMNAKNSRESI